jgi:hypothetical protein
MGVRSEVILDVTSAHTTGSTHPKSRAVSAAWRAHLRKFAGALSLLVLLSLAFHQYQHRDTLDLGAQDNYCTLCHASANLLPGSDPVAIIPPAAYTRIHLPLAPQTAPLQKRPTAGFSSRAPPPPVSV